MCRAVIPGGILGSPGASVRDSFYIFSPGDAKMFVQGGSAFSGGRADV